MRFARVIVVGAMIGGVIWQGLMLVHYEWHLERLQYIVFSPHQSTVELWPN